MVTNLLTHGLPTIAAIATPRGVGGVAIIRVSGDHAYMVADAIVRTSGKPPSLRSPNTFFHARLATPADTHFIDDALVLCFHAPRSYTGEDVVEFHGHGGAAVSARVLQAALDAGAQPAAPGEFTRRAFLNGRLDLVQAEAVMDLIHARSERAAMAAADQLSGSLSNCLLIIYDILLNARADIEASLDFDDLELDALALTADIADRIRDALAQMDGLLAGWADGHLLRDGALIPLVGEPNAGKSSLLNALLGRDRAIVTARAGTTRDTIEELLVVDGIPLRLVDTAGLRDTACDIEREGIQRTEAVMRQAELALLVVDAARLTALPSPSGIIRELMTRHGLTSATTLVALNKWDHVTPPLDGEGLPSLLTTGDSPSVSDDGQRAPECIACSAVTGYGIDELRWRLVERLGHQCGGPARAVIAARHREGLMLSRAAAEEAAAALEGGLDDAVLAAEALRRAQDPLAELLGRSYSEDLLDRIFSRFCIGK